MAADSSLMSNILARLTIGNLLLFIFAYVAFRIIQQIVYYRFLSPIKDFPGPFWASVTRLWIAWYNLRGTEVQALEAVHKKYGEQITLSACHERSKTPLVRRTNFHFARSCRTDISHNASRFRSEKPSSDLPSSSKQV